MYNRREKYNEYEKDLNTPEIVYRLHDLADIGRASTEETVALFEMNKMMQQIRELEEKNRNQKGMIEGYMREGKQMQNDIKALRALVRRYKISFNNAFRTINKIWAERGYKTDKPKEFDENSSLWDAAEAITESTDHYEKRKDDTHIGDAGVLSRYL